MNILRSIFLTAPALALSLSACTGVDEKGEEDAPFDNFEQGKDDSFRSPTLHGELAYGVGNQTTLTDNEQFHAWDFSLSDDAAVTLETVIGTPNLDTVMYLYRQDATTGYWGRYIGKNDDADKSTVASRLSRDLYAGNYRVLVKGFKSSLRGDFAVNGQCDGPGCRVSTCDPDKLVAIPDASADACGEVISRALDGTIASTGFNSTTLADRCGLPRAAQLAVDYYVSYWEDQVGIDFEDAFQWDPTEPIVLNVDWTNMSNGTTYVSIDADGDEDGLDLVIDDSNRVAAHFQHNQSPDFALYCEGGNQNQFGEEDCGFTYLNSMVHHARDEQAGASVVTGANAAAELGAVALLAYEEYVRQLQLSDTDSVTVDWVSWDTQDTWSSWESAGRVTVSASGHPTSSFELAADSDTPRLFTQKNGTDDRTYECREL